MYIKQCHQCVNYCINDHKLDLRKLVQEIIDHIPDNQKYNLSINDVFEKLSEDLKKQISSKGPFHIVCKKCDNNPNDSCRNCEGRGFTIVSTRPVNYSDIEETIRIIKTKVNEIDLRSKDLTVRERKLDQAESASKEWLSLVEYRNNLEKKEEEIEQKEHILTLKNQKLENERRDFKDEKNGWKEAIQMKNHYESLVSNFRREEKVRSLISEIAALKHNLQIHKQNLKDYDELKIQLDRIRRIVCQ